MDSAPLRRSAIEWTTQRRGAAAEHVGIELGGRHVLRSEQFLHGADVVPGFQQARGKAVPKRVAAGRLFQSGLPTSRLDGTLQPLLVHVLPAYRTTARIDTPARCRE